MYNIHNIIGIYDDRRRNLFVDENFTGHIQYYVSILKLVMEGGTNK